jgi:PAS domain S-box-containing protein
LSFRLKTILGIALIESVLLLILVFSGLSYLADSNELQLQQRAISTANLFAAATKDAILATDLATLESATNEILTNADVAYVRISSNGIVLAENGDSDALKLIRKEDTSLDTVTDEIYDVKSEIRVEGQLYGIIELGLSTTYVDSLLVEARRSAFSLAGAEIVLVAIFSFILGTYLTRQLNRLRKATQTVARKGPGYQVEVTSNDELGEVARSFNFMSENLRVLYSDLQDALEAQKQMVNSSGRNEAMNEAILSSSLDAMITIDSKGNIVEFNHIAEQIFGWRKEQVKGIPIVSTIIPESYREAHDQGLQKYLETGEGPVLGKRLELEAINKEGHVFPIEIAISPIITNEETLFTAFIRDLTDAKAAELKQQLARKQAEQSSEAKSRFLATMSHEIRSPLNAIMAMNALLLETNLDEKQAEIANTVNEGSEILMSLINDILDFSKIESGSLILHNDWFDLTKSVKGIVNLLTNQSNLERITVNTIFSPGLYQYYLGDQSRIGQVLINLLSNAIKFTESGSVTIELESNIEGNGILLKVTDTGIGISKDQMNNIFDEFTQVDDSDNRRFGGTGLGLSIAYQLVKLMNGEISVSSEKNKGSCFIVELPLEGDNKQRATIHAETSSFSNPDFQNVDLLLAEDSATNRKVIETSLSKMGLKVDTAENGREAVNLAMENHYDLILMDLAMPEMDGLEATRRIRGSDGKNKNTRIVAITANAFEEDRERCFAAGMDDFVSKPINIVSFRKDIQRWLQEGSGGRRLIDKSQLVDHPTFNQLYKDTGAEVLPDIFGLFRAECRDRLIVMKDGYEKLDWNVLEDQAHALKSSSGSFGAITLQAFAREVEVAARAKNKAALDKNIPQLKEIVNQSLEELEALLGQAGRG